MNPDRILLAEIRGREAWDALKIVGFGHEGLMTPLHAGSPEECIEGLIDRCYENLDCRDMPFDVLLRKVLKSIDVIVSIDIHGDIRRMSDVYFNPLHLKDMRGVFSKGLQYINYRITQPSFKYEGDRNEKNNIFRIIASYSTSVMAADACEVVICIYGKATGNGGGNECHSAERAFFNIVKKNKHGFLPVIAITANAERHRQNNADKRS